ncbi:hypothetical protein JOB18_043597 [Solea senegalensis]|uniref:Laminin subunit gamma-2-like n=1 Tax=Solea senegalensis TaxID=28829 RepID=A0AAV6TAZ9_SOLSE|nr:laminin subunit gamma-2 [Solea senegalensis]KAG7526661.1 hypothetical protein JOB18_043597 [Solea senegalensis]
MRCSWWISVCGLLAAVCSLHATHTHYSTLLCECNGKSGYCLRDDMGLHCVDCQGNTEGRHCERCKAGFYLQGAGLSCMPCRCNATGSVSSTCDSRGRCSCKQGVSGQKCNRCPDRAIGPNGCTQRRQTREDSGSETPPCFCYGHSSRCSAHNSFSVYIINSSFTDGPDGWTVSSVHGITPSNIHFRWSPSHGDVEVISKNSLPVYLYAPVRYLGNQLLSYGQNFSFSLRLDRGVRHPSTNDVILEGGGLRVSASLGDLRSIVPCGQKIKYSFRLDGSDSRWRPQLSSLQFQTLLQNLTDIKIRATFGENGRGYLDDVRLVSAQRRDGVPAPWVRTCSCPSGYAGEFCERCADGFRRSRPAEGAFGPCEPCSCTGGSCDPMTGDCYSADQTPEDLSCTVGFYRNAWKTCVKCPCPHGLSCSLPAGSLQPLCDRCPAGTTGPLCDVCQDGFYGDPCRPCQCNGHIDVSVAGSCDRRSGECLKCVNNTRGQNCETCVRGFYHSRLSDPCKPCDCDLSGSESRQCDDVGHCQCRPGHEGLKCQRVSCPSCFNPIKTQMDVYMLRLKELDTRLSDMDGGLTANSGLKEALQAAEQLVDDLQDNSEELLEMEKSLQSRLSSISRSQLTTGQDVHNVQDTVEDIKQLQRTYKTEVDEVQTLVTEMRRNLDKAKADLRSAEFPLGDASLPSTLWSSLVKTAKGLADTHQTKAEGVEDTANAALSDSEKSLALVRTLQNQENRVKEQLGDLKTMFDQTLARVKGLEDQAVHVSAEAKDESKMADDMYKNITNMERNIPMSLKGQMDAMMSRLDDLKDEVDENISGFEMMQDGLQRDRSATEKLLAKGKLSQQDANKLLDRVYVAEADTAAALRHISSNTKELDDALNALKGFDQQIDGGKALADAAIRRLPSISATVQQAISNNNATGSSLKDVLTDYSHTLGLMDGLQDLVTSLEGTFAALPSRTGLVNEAVKMNADAKGLKTRAIDVAGDLDFELDNAKKLEADAQQTASEAVAAFNNAKGTRDAVGQTLRDITAMLANMNQPGAVDEDRLKQLEAELAGAQRDIEGGLKPRLVNMEQQEDAMRHRLTTINLDIDTVLRDIANLEDILKAVPEGCLNSSPIEEP